MSPATLYGIFMRSIQEIFTGEFSAAHGAVVQKLRPDERNMAALDLGYSESWPPLALPSDVLALALGTTGTKHRQILAGFITDIQPSIILPGRFRFYVDRFRPLGEHNLSITSDADFYGNGGGGGARNYIPNLARTERNSQKGNVDEAEVTIPEGSMERRLVWVRKNHHHFRDPVWEHWEGRCAVTNVNCDGLLVASHIHPWAKSTSQEKTDPHNGLLLAAPLDSLFDRGWISFLDTGEMVVRASLSDDTQRVFGIEKEGMRISRPGKIGQKMAGYLKRHRKFYGFE